MTCRFCGSNEKLQRSHIIPEFFYEYDEHHRILEVKGERRPRFQQKGTRQYLLCFRCEQYFNDHFEKPMKRQWIDNQKIPDTLPPDALPITGLDYPSFKLFHLSVLWRAHIANHTGVDLGRHERPIHTMLTNRDPGPPKRYPLFAVALRLPTSEPARGAIMLPNRSRVQGQTVYCSVFSGCAWYQVISSHDVPEGIREMALTEHGSMIAIIEDLRIVKEVDTLMKIYEQNRIKHGWADPWTKNVRPDDKGRRSPR